MSLNKLNFVFLCEWKKGKVMISFIPLSVGNQFSRFKHRATIYLSNHIFFIQTETFLIVKGTLKTANNHKLGYVVTPKLFNILEVLNLRFHYCLKKKSSREVKSIIRNECLEFWREIRLEI